MIQVKSNIIGEFLDDAAFIVQRVDLRGWESWIWRWQWEVAAHGKVRSGVATSRRAALAVAKSAAQEMQAQPTRHIAS